MMFHRYAPMLLLACTALFSGCSGESGSGGGSFSDSKGWRSGEAAQLAPWLARNLQALKGAHDDHLLSDAEYITFRQSAIDHALKAPAPTQLSEANADSGVWLSDELRVASGMVGDKSISQDEFQKFKSHLIEIYHR